MGIIKVRDTESFIMKRGKLFQRQPLLLALSRACIVYKGMCMCLYTHMYFPHTFKICTLFCHCSFQLTAYFRFCSISSFTELPLNIVAY